MKVAEDRRNIGNGAVIDMTDVGLKEVLVSDLASCRRTGAQVVRAELERRTDLEKETIADVLRILKEEFDKD